MSQSLNSMYGAVDLGSLAKKPQAAAPSDTPAGETLQGPYILDVDASNLRSVLEDSRTVPILASFYSSASDASLAVDTQLRALATQYAGRFQLARIDTDTSADIAQAFGVTGIPAAVAILQAQPIPLFQGVPGEGELGPMVDRILEAAGQYGITGRMSGGNVPETPVTPPLPAHMQEAYDAFDAGNYSVAHDEFAAALKDNPGNEAAKVGVQHVELIQRVSVLDRDAVLRAAKDAPLTDIELQLQAADIEVALGRPDAAFARLIDVVKANPGKERDVARERLITLFDVVGTHEPLVTQARKALALALF